MGLDGYVGNSNDQRRIQRQQKEREEEKKLFEELKAERERNIDKSGLRQFGAGTSEVLENVFKNETVGLVTREEFVEKRNTLKERLEEDARKRKRQAEDQVAREKDRRRKLKEKANQKSKLSFGDDEEEEQQMEEGGAAAKDVAAEVEKDKEKEASAASASAAAAAAAATNNGNGINGNGKVRGSGLGKDPTVRTDFLPDKDREQAEEQLREQLKQEWELRQQLVKNEPIQITYSYWNGSGHRRTITVRKGDSVEQFLSKAREQLSKEFREVRAMSVGNMMYIKEDLILPHVTTFHDLIVNKARGKSGPLFHFDVHEDIRLQNDATVEKDESHAGKIVDRHWYDRNKHIFPASRWEVYDPQKKWESYTIHGD